jgi:chromate transport protein ChrA
MEGMKPAGDILSIGVVLATLASWLPSVAAIFTIIWTAIRIYETQTVQRLLGKAT